MNCGQFQDTVHDLVREEPLDNGIVEEAFAHAESCEACDALLGEAESLSAGLHALAARHVVEQAPPSVEAALLREFAERHAPVRLAGNRGRYFALATAAIAAAAVFLVVVAMRPRATRPDVTTQTASDAAPVAGSEVVSPEADPALIDDELPGDEAASVASFEPLTEAFDASAANGGIDDGMVVRVELSRAALESFGLPVDGSGDDQVLADLVGTSDGMPQAIRVLSW
jgi:hypothetical protein